MLPEDILAGLVPAGSPITESLMLVEPMALQRWLVAAAPVLQAGPVNDAQRMELPIQMIGSTAVVSVVGMLNKRVRYPGVLSSYIATVAAVKAAVADPKVTDIMLKIDSPGGYVSGVAEASDAIHQAATVKPITAVVDGLGASAAYWLASQAGAIYAGREDEVGSIGVLAVVYDMSEAAKKEGIKAEVFATGKYKWTGVPGTAVTDEQKAYLQGLVNEKGEAFVRDIARGRHMSVESVQAVADGRVFGAKKALELGLIDGIKSFVEAYDDLQARRSREDRLRTARLDVARNLR